MRGLPRDPKGGGSDAGLAPQHEWWSILGGAS